MNPYPFMTDELGKIAADQPVTMTQQSERAGALAGFIGGAILGSKVLGPGVGTILGGLSGVPFGMAASSKLRSMLARRKETVKKSSIEKDAIGLFLAGLAAKGATKFGPKLLRGASKMGLMKGDRSRKLRGAIATHRKGLRRAGKGAMGVDTALGVGSMATGAMKSVGQPRRPVRVSSPA